MNAQVTWYISGMPKFKETNFTAFADNMDLRTAKPIAENALLFSLQSRDWGQTMPYYPSPLGTAECMNDLHMQYTTLIEHSLKYDKLKQYKTVMIPSASCLSDKQIEELLKYAKSGGRLYLTAHAGVFNEIGDPRKIWPFAKALGLKNPLPMHFVRGGELQLAGSDKKVTAKTRFIKILQDKSGNSKTILTLTDSRKNKYTVGVESNYGKGKIFYISGQLANANMEPEITILRKWKFARNSELFELFAKVLKKATTESEEFVPVNIPEKVLCTIYRQPDENNTATMVHLLNATAVDLNPGQTVPKTAPNPAFPGLKEDIKFRIKLPEFKQAYAASPDFVGHKPVNYKKLTDNWYEVTVPANLLECYSIIWFR
jgi:hypothetical protein